MSPGGAPPVPGRSRHPAAAACGLAAALLFVLYETTMPFDFRFTAAQLADGWAKAALRPFTVPGGGPSGLVDVAGNIPLFVPLGFFLALVPLLGRAGRWRPPLLALAGTAVSLSVETLQLFSPLRYPQSTDVITNTLGAAAGVLLAVGGGQALFDRLVDGFLRRLRDDPLSLLVGGLTAAILVGALLPFDLSISPRHLARQWRELDLSRMGAAAAPGGRLTAWTGLLKLGWLFAFWGAATAHWLGGRRRRPWLAAVAGGAALAVAAEGLQLFVVSRTLDVHDPLAGLLGAAAGATIALSARRLGLSGRASLALALAGYGCYLALDLVSPLDPPLVKALLRGDAPAGRPLLFEPVPFHETALATRMMVLGDWAARAARFVPLGAWLAWSGSRAGRRWLLAAAIVAAALGLELLEGRIGMARGDMTDVVMAAAGLATGWFLGERLAVRWGLGGVAARAPRARAAAGAAPASAPAAPREERP